MSNIVEDVESHFVRRSTGVSVDRASNSSGLSSLSTRSSSGPLNARLSAAMKNAASMIPEERPYQAMEDEAGAMTYAY